MNIWLVRHAESSSQASDAPLTALGETQAQALVPALAKLKIDTVFSSPYRRAVATIAPYAATKGLPIQQHQDFRERLLAPKDQPDWLQHIKTSFADADYHLPDGESLNETAFRMRRGISSVFASNTGRVAIASHGNAISALFMQLNPDFSFSDWQEMRNPDLFCVSVSGGILQSYERIEL